MNASLSVTMITAGLLGLIVLFLSGYVVAGRVKFKINSGDGGNDEMRQRVRAQANFVEYVPIGLMEVSIVTASPARVQQRRRQ